METLVDRVRQKLISKFSYYFIPHRRLYQCKTVYLGNDYGGWTICPEGISESSLIYSFGVGEDASFDLGIIGHFGATVHAFDPTPRSIEWVNRQTWPEGFHFHPIGIGSTDRLSAIFPPENPEWVSHTIIPTRKKTVIPVQVQLLRLETIAEMLGHHEIDILKMDIEGAEYEVVDDLVNDTIIRIRQILVEFHHWIYPGISFTKTTKAINKLEEAGYMLYNISKKGVEFSFIHL